MDHLAHSPFLTRLMRPVFEPNNIYAHKHEEQDVILWYNRALWHSITEFPESYGPRIMHQCESLRPPFLTESVRPYFESLWYA